ncbi:regulator of G protein signaling domain-containing protein [Halteromyces radiatus]|uniref:regulator of G protein signaling domain-containing protein n=1 Tax=Halteromyces radiatus TaxID=101107 RepID=UPI002220CADD|nr:regulator of G protein signaling domain-containing protein [Halteromyces radiatus]KAI8089091.1 regulator of G protein signaling domain-containing protein [Halteromyces radiatus]
MESDRSRQAYTSMMKFTIDGRPYLKDIHDLFAALIVQTPLTTHRYLFRNYYNTFSSEDAIMALGSLRFSHTVRTPDPNDPNKTTRTTTTTTFNMAKDMAKALCSQFQACHLMQNAVDPNSNRNSSNNGSGTISDKAIWQLTPKGLCVLQDFCIRTEVDMTNLRKHFSDIPPIQLVRLDRHSDDDQLMLGRQNVSLIFMVMITSLPLEGELLSQQQQQQQQQGIPVPPLSKSKKKEDKNSSSSSSGSSVSSSGSSTASSSLPSNAAPFAMSTHVVNGDSRVQLLGNYLLTLSKTNQQQNQQQQQKVTFSAATKLGKKMRTAFSTQLACDWLIDYSTVSSYEEGESLLAEFVKYAWVECQDAKYADQYLRASKNIILVVTPKGKQVLAETTASSSSSSSSNNNNSSGVNNSTISSRKESTLSSSSTTATSSTAAANRLQQTSRQQEEDETTLREMLAQDPESVMITTHQTTTTSSSDLVVPHSQNSSGSTSSNSNNSNNNSNNNNNQTNNGFNARSRPPSTAMDYPAPSVQSHPVSSSLSMHSGYQGGNANNNDPKESNATKLKQILDDAQLRSLFKDFLRNNFCEENLDFWIDYSTLRRKIRNQSPALPSQNQKDLLEDAYDLWATYLKPGAASELNVEHSLRQEMARVVNSMVTVVPTYIPGQQTSKNTLVISSHSVSSSLRMILKWLDQVNDHICRLMSSDSVPKFVRTAKYKKIMDAREAADRKEQDDMVKQLDQQHLDGSSMFFDVEAS